jgi:hypothetical protein
MRLISVVVSTCREKVSAFTKARRTLNNEDRGWGARFVTEASSKSESRNRLDVNTNPVSERSSKPKECSVSVVVPTYHV